MPSPSLAANVVGAAHANFSRGGVPSTRYFTRHWGGWGALVIRDVTSTGKTLPPRHLRKMLKQLLQQVAVIEASANPGSGLVVIPPSASTWLLSHPEGPIPGIHPRLIQWSAHFRGNPWQKIWWDECEM